jgi:hypothetical protein
MKVIVMSEEEEHFTRDQVKTIVQETVRETLTSLGMNIDDPVALQKDMHHLREWREGTDAVKRKGMLVIVGTLVAATMSLIWLGARSYLHLPPPA